MNVSVDVTNATCFGACDATLSTNASGGTPPYTYVWWPANEDTTGMLVGACAGSYQMTVMDDLGNSDTAIVVVSESPAISLGFVVTNASCSGGADGGIEILVSNGNPPYTFLWSNGMTTQSAFGLSAGSYSILVADANGCTAEDVFVILEGNLSANISLVSNDPCAGPIELEAVATGGTGNISYLWSTEETTQNIIVSGLSVVNVLIIDDLGCEAIATAYLPTVDGEVNSYVSGWLNRGFCNWLFPLVSNNGCQTYSGPVSVTLDSDVNFSTINPTPDDVSGSTITWNSITLQPGEQFMPEIRVCVPLTVACGDEVSVSITADGNTETHLPLVLCSYDPNDKQVWPQGIGPEGYIMGTEELTYMIRFQNTGAAPATFIHVLDALDEDLDLLSFRVLATSHAMELSIGEDRVLDFFFDNINLPDSTSDPAGSNGFILYAIDMLPGLPQGTEIENTAEIYFDFNPPVITNTTLNTIDNTVGVANGVQQTGAISIYPNPGSDRVTVSRAGMSGFSLQLHDATGRLLRSVSSSASSMEMDVSGLPAGIYHISLSDADGRHQGRLVKQ